MLGDPPAARWHRQLAFRASQKNLPPQKAEYRTLPIQQ